MSDDEFEKARDTKAKLLLSQRIKYSVDRMVESSNPTLMTSFNEDSFIEGADWGREYALAEITSLRESLKLAVEAFGLIIKRDPRLPDFSDRYETVTAYNVLAKIKAKHGDL
jgi:hypothetical protein